MKRVLVWLRTIRPQTLFASLVPVLVALWVVHHDHIPVVAYRPMLVGVLTALCAVSLQVLANLINDYYDFVRGADKAGRTGFKRALAEGEVSQRQMAMACLIALSIAVCTGAYLVLVGGWVILAVGISAILFAWLYTATSHSLAYLGIADIFVFLYYGVIASAGTAYLLTHVFSQKVFYAGAVCGLISMCVLMINNLRDVDEDRGVGKRTLVFRVGKSIAEAVMLVEVLLMPLFAWLAFGISPSMLVGVAGLILFFAVRKAKGAQYNKCLLCTGLMNVVYLILVLLSS